MQKPILKKYGAFFYAAFAVLAAAVLRQIGFYVNEQMNLLCNILRALIHIGLFFVWGISIHIRIIHPQVRRYLIAIVALMLFWLAIRSIRYSLGNRPWILRHLWYLYYLPMLYIPCIAVFVALTLGKPDNFRLSNRVKYLYIFSAALFALVLTNDLHQLVFVFPDDAIVWQDDYRYAIGYFLAVGWMILCTVTALAVMLRKCRIPNSRKALLLPFIPVGLAVVYSTLYLLRILNVFPLRWMRIFVGDMTAVFCLLFAVTLESCIQCGLIQANTHYMELFDASTVGAQIIDSEGHVVLSSSTAPAVNIKTILKAMQESVMLDGGIRLSGAPIKNGHVIWTEDISALLGVLHELQEVKENLQDNYDILEEEYALKTRETHIAEQERLYDTIHRDTAKQILLMEKMIEQADHAGTEEERKRILRKMLVVGVYLKRRSNLVILSNEDSVLEAKELDLSIKESINNLETLGVICGFHSELTGIVSAKKVIAMYDFFEEITERSLECMSSLMVFVSVKAEFIIFRVAIDSASDFSDLASDTVTAMRDEDGEWILTLYLDIGDDRQ